MKKLVCTYNGFRIYRDENLFYYIHGNPTRFSTMQNIIKWIDDVFRVKSQSPLYR